MSLAAAALALLCGLTPVRCRLAPTVTIAVAADVPGVRGAMTSYDPRTRTVYLKPAGPEVAAALLAHELTHVEQIDAGETYTPATCRPMELEAFQAQAEVWSALHGGDPSFTSPPGWAVLNADNDCRLAFHQ